MSFGAAGRPNASPSLTQPFPDPRSPVPTRAAESYWRREAGASLIEALVAVGLIAGALVGTADLAARSIRSLSAARDRSVGALIAAQKIEQLLAQPLRPADSPAGALDADTAGFVEYLDARGRVSGQDHDCEGTVYARRWSVAPLARDARVLVIHVRAGRCLGPVGAGSCATLTDGPTLVAARPEAW
jgi:Tfp pilus assembly protein PilV